MCQWRCSCLQNLTYGFTTARLCCKYSVYTPLLLYINVVMYIYQYLLYIALHYHFHVYIVTYKNFYKYVCVLELGIQISTCNKYYFVINICVVTGSVEWMKPWPVNLACRIVTLQKYPYSMDQSLFILKLWTVFRVLNILWTDT